MNTETITMEEAAPPLEPVLSPQELRRFLRAVPGRRPRDYRDRALLALLAGTGARVGEVLQLKVGDLRLRRDNTVVVVLKTSKRKDDHHRPVVVGLPFAAPIQRYLERQRQGLRWWLLPGRWNQHLSVRQGQKIVKRALRAVGRDDLRCHSLRHSHLTLVVSESGDPWLAAQVAGHTSTRQIFKTYGRYLTKDADRAAAHVSAAMRRPGRPADC